jgi:hypothetical protein
MAICFVTAENPDPLVYLDTLRSWIFFVPRISPFLNRLELCNFQQSAQDGSVRHVAGPDIKRRGALPAWK